LLTYLLKIPFSRRLSNFIPRTNRKSQKSPQGNE
jgi:hypothetical protein